MGRWRGRERQTDVSEIQPRNLFFKAILKIWICLVVFPPVILETCLARRLRRWWCVLPLASCLEALEFTLPCEF